MNKKNDFMKSTPQLHLEKILHHIKEKGLTIDQLRSNPEYASLYQEFCASLISIIQILVHEKSIHDLIISIASAYTSQYYNDLQEYDILYEIIADTYLGLFNVITKAGNTVNNSGRIRIDTYLSQEPEIFVLTLRKYIRNNIVLDFARRCSNQTKHLEPNIIADENGEICSKLDSVKYNKQCIENTFDNTDDFARRISYEPNICSTLISAVISRFMARKPVAGFIYLHIMNGTYNPMNMVEDLKTKDFNILFHSLLHELEANYKVDLSCYNNTIFNANKYLSSFRDTKDNHARSRIDRLATQTRKDVQKIQAFIEMKTNYIDIKDKYYCLK